MFDLEKAVRNWLRLFRKHRAFNHGSIREMELHIRDHIDDLIQKGHTEVEAFNEAIKEFGDVTDIAKEEFQNLTPKPTVMSRVQKAMFGNSLKIAIRTFTHQPFFTLLNTLGLAVGLAGALLIALYLVDEFSFDKMFSDADRIYRINIDNRTNGEYSEYASAPGPMAGVLASDCPQVEMVTRFREVSNVVIRDVDATLNVKENKVTAVDTSFFDMFGLQLLEGNPKSCFDKPNSIVLTREAAKRHFGSQNVIGKSLIFNNDKVFVVTGVIDEIPRNSFLRDHSVFMSLVSFEDEKTIAWNTWYFPTFVKLKEGARPADLQAFLNTVKDRYLIPWAMTFVPGLTVEIAKEQEKKSGNFMNFNTTALTDIHLYSGDRNGEFSANSNIQNVYIMSFIAGFLLLMAAVNFMNLATANSLKRAKEVAIRKTLGSSKTGLIRQFLTESVLTSLLGLVIAIMIVALALPFFNELAAKNISIPFFNPVFWIAILAAAIVLGLLSGGYPAFFMSGFTAAKVLKGANGIAGGGKIRNVLVVFQFAMSVFLIASTLVVFEQVNFIRHKDLGFSKDQVLIIEDVQSAGGQLESFKEQVSQMSQVEVVSLSSYLPTPSERMSITFFQDKAFENGTFKSENALIIENWAVDYDYVHALDLKMVAGRNFDKKYGTDSMALLINETTAKMLGVEPQQAIGLRLTSDIHRQDKANMTYYTVVGVVQNFHFETLRNGIDGLILHPGAKANRMIVKLNAGSFKETIENIHSQWEKIAPQQPFSYYFMDDSFDDTYRTELRLGSIFIIFTFLSLFIACLGLFGLSTFNAERRTKEIGIRKVLGASVRQITFHLSYDFLRLVLIAIVLSLPLSWYVMSHWLEEFTFKVEIGWWIYAMAAIFAIAISMATVSYQSIKSSVANPVDSLRFE